MIEWTDALVRLGAAAMIGGAIGLNRDLHHKPTGLRTLGLVGVGSALIVLAASDIVGDPAGTSRVIQGVVAGLGFLGAGVIVRDGSEAKVRGLTTASAVWVTASIGCACGLANWKPVVVACVIIALLLGLGGRFEHWVHDKFDGGKGKGPGNPV